MKKISKNLEDTSIFAKEIVDFALKNKDESGKIIFVLKGDLGSGKTSFVKEVAKEIGVKEDVISPTFLIIKKYTPEKQFDCLIHIDLYRVESAGELGAIKFKEVFESKNSIIFIEWPEKSFGMIPKGSFIIETEFVDENTRIYKTDFL